MSERSEKPPRFALALVFVISAALAVYLHRDFTRHHWNVPLTADAAAFREATSAPNVTSHDVPHYLHYAEHLRNRRDFTVFLSAYWPPGMAIVIALLTSIFGTAAYALKMMLFAAAVWSATLWLWFRSIDWGSRQGLGAVWLNVFWLLPSFREWTIGVGAVGSESLATALFAASLAFTVRSFRHRDRERAFFAVFLLGLAANVRGEYDVIGTAVLLLAAALAVAAMRIRREALRRPGGHADRLAARLVPDPLQLHAYRRLVFSLFFVFFSMTLPWKTFLKSHYGHFSMSLAMYLDAEKVMWNRRPAAYAVAGNTACVIAPSRCSEVEQAGEKLTMHRKLMLAIGTFLENPVAWARHRLDYVDEFWIGYSWGSAPPLRALEAALYLLILLGSAVPWLASLRRGATAERQSAVMLFVVVGGYLAAYAAIMTIVHLEHRYTIAPKVVCLLAPLMALAIRSPRHRAASP